MIDNIKLDDDLTEAFITYQYRLENPFPIPYKPFDMMVLEYRRDPVFRSKVRSLVSGVIHIIDKHVGGL